METKYTWTVKNGEVIFTPDKEVRKYSHEKLVETIIQSYCYSYEDADYYAKELENLCLSEYSKELKRMKRPHRRKRKN
ncbi:hypothetical protein [Clostridium kluyveri]|uniref:Uncharacterized protein n=1 Tax=Clostridium kluyveri TaxID=1534 RepID=A0A1L5F8U9_CLOKL|nr:hypothetical protein [Clostridium kluyveri]APM39438.1 hypothetical protein BS101_12130 [Clostridium kluyveri]